MFVYTLQRPLLDNRHKFIIKLSAYKKKMQNIDESHKIAPAIKGGQAEFDDFEDVFP